MINKKYSTNKRIQLVYLRLKGDTYLFIACKQRVPFITLKKYFKTIMKDKSKYKNIIDQAMYKLKNNKHSKRIDKINYWCIKLENAFEILELKRKRLS